MFYRMLRMITAFERRMEAWVRDFIRTRRMASYLKSDRRPWRKGYHEYRLKYLREVVGNSKVLEIFRQGGPLPERYGFRLDARVIEIPWFLARVRNHPGQVLDAGSSLNYEFVLKAPSLANKRITIFTLAPEGQCYWKLGVSYVFGDMRELEFKDEHFDAIVCISTIEHVGLDNTFYTGIEGKSQEEDASSFLRAIKELRRVLKIGGELYITFPFGRYENHGWFQQFDAELTDRLIAEFSPSRCNETIFRYDPDGWKVSDRISCKDCRFFDVRKSKYFDPKSTAEYPQDYPAGERAVACLELHR